MKFLPVENLLVNVVSSDQDALQGDLKCSCGGDEFSLEHNGRVSRGLFSAVMQAKGEEFAIRARCSTCSQAVLLHCANWEMDDAGRSYAPFEMRMSRAQRWHIHVCYDWEEGQGMADGHWHCGYEDVAIDVREENSARQKRIFE